MVVTMNYIIAVILIFLCSSCSAVVPEIKNSVTGIYFFGEETSAFVPCSSKEVWWIDGNNGAMNKIEDLYASLVKPYGNFYIVVNGSFTPKQGNSDYVGILEPSELLSYSINKDMISKCVPNIEELK